MDPLLPFYIHNNRKVIKGLLIRLHDPSLPQNIRNETKDIIDRSLNYHVNLLCNSKPIPEGISADERKMHEIKRLFESKMAAIEYAFWTEQEIMNPKIYKMIFPDKDESKKDKSDKSDKKPKKD